MTIEFGLIVVLMLCEILTHLQMEKNHKEVKEGFRDFIALITENEKKPDYDVIMKSLKKLDKEWS